MSMGSIRMKELRLRGRIDGFSNAVSVWTIRLFEDETFSATIEPSVAHASRARLLLYNGQAAESSQCHYVARFHIVQILASGASWSVVCKARLDLNANTLRGTWSHDKSSVDWPAIGIERDNQPFQLDAADEIPSKISRTVCTLDPLGPGRFSFRGVLEMDQDLRVEPWSVDLLIVDDYTLKGVMARGSVALSIHGIWSEDSCSWNWEGGGFVVSTFIDKVSLLGECVTEDTRESIELILESANRQWQSRNHDKTPASLQNALIACKELCSPNISESMWHHIFSFCDYEWFEPENDK